MGNGDQNALSFTAMNNNSLGENQIILFYVLAKKVIWSKTKMLILGENRFAHNYTLIIKYILTPHTYVMSLTYLQQTKFSFRKSILCC